MRGISRRRLASIMGAALFTIGLLPSSVAAVSPPGPADVTATKLVFTSQPTNSLAGAAINPAVTVSEEDASGNVMTSDSTSQVTVAISNNAGGGTLAGGDSTTVSNGVATFSNLKIDTAGVGYTLVATSSGPLSAATSNAFTVIGSPAQIAFGQQPSNTVAGAAMTPSVTVKVEDALGTVVPVNTGSVTLTLASGPGSLTNANASFSNGVATFTGFSIDTAGTNDTLLATDGSWTATSNVFTVTGAYHLAFVTSPNGGSSGAIWSQQPAVEVLDSGNNLVASDNSSLVSLSISTNPGGTLACLYTTTTLHVTGGIAYFSGCYINATTPGNYTLLATSGAGYASAVSGSFSVGASETLAFVTQPGGGAAGTTWTSQPVVEVLNASNAVVTTDNSTVVYLSIGTNPAGGTLSCTGNTYETVVNGYAYFSGCSINLASSSAYTLTATSSPSWTPATSSAFHVSSSGQVKLAISSGSALGLKPASGYTTKTPKYATVGRYVTWQFTGGAALAGQRVNILVATRVNGVWSTPKYLKSAWADSSGVVTFARSLKSAGAINVRIQWPGSSTYAVSTSTPLGAYWK